MVRLCFVCFMGHCVLLCSKLLHVRAITFFFQTVSYITIFSPKLVLGAESLSRVCWCSPSPRHSVSDWLQPTNDITVAVVVATSEPSTGEVDTINHLSAMQCCRTNYLSVSGGMQELQAGFQKRLFLCFMKLIMTPMEHCEQTLLVANLLLCFYVECYAFYG